MQRRFEAVNYLGFWFVVRWDKPDAGICVHGPCLQEEAEELASRWNAPWRPHATGCYVCGDTRENPDGWECPGCGTI